MGDVIMSGPALRALKQTFSCRITLLTSSMGKLITGCMPEIDEVITADLPWVKANGNNDADGCSALIEKLKAYQFDGAVIFTVYSQNPLPAAMLAFLAKIPRCLAYCRENPYALLTDWLPDKEPYEFILHQVERDLKLVQSIGANAADDHLRLSFSNEAKQAAVEKMEAAGIDRFKPYIILHPGVSERKRQYPLESWIATAKQIKEQSGLQIIITGSGSEKDLAGAIQKAAGPEVITLAGVFSVEEFVALIQGASLVISVNTATIHIAAATNTPVVVLYALTNPQHTPWKSPAVVLPFSTDENLASRNEIIHYVNRHFFKDFISSPAPEDVCKAAMRLLKEETTKYDVRSMKSNYR
jgi:lipopolysaccharide heptosyltransferase II